MTTTLKLATYNYGTAVNTSFGQPNGMTYAFAFSVLGVPVINLTTTPIITRTDWQGQQLLYATSRTNLITWSQNFGSGHWSAIGGLTITPNAAIAPDGTMTANKFTDATTTGLFYTNGGGVGSISAGTPLYYEVWLQPGTITSAWIQGAESIDGLALNLTGAGSVTSNGSSVTSATITLIDGWYKVQATILAWGSSGDTLYVGMGPIAGGYTGTGTGTLFVWGAHVSLTPGGYIPTTGAAASVTDYALSNNLAIFTNYNVPCANAQFGTGNNSAATFTIGTTQGVMPVIGYVGRADWQGGQHANLLSYSSALNNAVWTNLNCTITIPGNITDPVGGYNANVFTESSDGSPQYHGCNASRGIAGTPECLSVYAKAGTRTQISLQVGAVGSVFDLSGGTVLSGSGVIQAVSNGWYRCSLAVTNPANTNTLIFMASGGTSNYTGNGSGYLYAFGAQMEYGAAATSFLPTTSSVNISWFGNQTQLFSTARKNWCTYSASVGTAPWGLNYTTNSIPGTVMDPSGGMNANHLLDNTSNNVHTTDQQNGFTAGTIITQSVYAMAGEYGWMIMNEGSVVTATAYFNLNAGTIGAVQGTDYSGNAPIASIMSVGNGWYRCSLTFACGATCNHQFGPTTGNSVYAYAGTGTSGIYVWGAQQETGPVATGYIATVASQSTITDYSQAGLNITFGQTPPSGAGLWWSGYYPGAMPNGVALAWSGGYYAPVTGYASGVTLDLGMAQSQTAPTSPTMSMDIATVSNQQQIVQDVASLIQTYQGEVYYDTSVGIPWNTNVLAQPYAPTLLKPMLQNAALTVPGVVQAQVLLTGYVNSRIVSGSINILDATGVSLGLNF
jgi:hypothetical protein